MDYEIEAIFMDVGNTLRILTADDIHQFRAKQRITELLNITDDPEVFCQALDTRYKQYRKWAFENCREANETELWTKWLAPEHSAEFIAPISVELTYQYRQSMGLRVMVDNGKQVIKELHQRGYKLGLISNVITSQEIPDWLMEDNLSHYFQSVALSAVTGIRKPDPEIYYSACRKAGVMPANCVYIGDNLKRDVTGTRAAGFGMVVIITSREDFSQTEITEENKPDAIITEFTDLLELFPLAPMVNTEKIHQLTSNALRNV